MPPAGRADAVGLALTIFWPLVMLLVWLCLTGALVLARRPRSVLPAPGVCALARPWLYVVALATGLSYGALLPPAAVFFALLTVDVPVVYIGWRLVSRRRPREHRSRPKR